MSAGAFDQVARSDDDVADDTTTRRDGVGRRAYGGVLNHALDIICDEACHDYCCCWATACVEAL